MKICLFGAGPGAMAMACRLMEAGHEAGLCELAGFEANLEPIRKSGAIKASGMIDGRFEPAMITLDADKALNWADMIMAVTHAAAHEAIAGLLAKHLTEPKPVILCPGYVGGGRRLSRQVKATAQAGDWAVLECSVLPFACRKPAGDSVSIHGEKRRFLVSPCGRGDCSRAQALMQELFSGVSISGHELEAGLNEANFIIHSCVVLTNWGHLESGEPWTFYRQGMTKGIGGLIESVDAERLAVLKAHGLTTTSLVEWLLYFYKDQGMKGKSIYELLGGFPPFANSPGPGSPEHRYLTEDIIYGLVPMSLIADSVGVKVPLTKSLIHLADTLCKGNFQAMGENMKQLLL